MSKQALFALALSFCLILASCAPAAVPTSQVTASPTEPQVQPTAALETSEETELAPVKVAFIAGDVLTDMSWFQAQYDALKGMEEKGLIELATSEKVSDADTERVIRDYVNSGYDLIIAGSYNFGDATLKVAAEYPDVAFSWSGGTNTVAPNVTEYDPPFCEGYYLVGLIAGKMTKTNKVAFVGAFTNPVTVAIYEAFVAGAKSVNSNIEGMVAYSGDWNDVSKARETAMALAEAGVDYFSASGQGPALGAVKAAQEKGALATGYVNPDFYKLAPETIVTTVVWDPTPVFTEMVHRVQEGTYRYEYFKYSIAEGAISLAPYHEWDSKIPQEVKDIVNQATNDIKSGKLVVAGCK